MTVIFILRTHTQCHSLACQRWWQETWNCRAFIALSTDPFSVFLPHPPPDDDASPLACYCHVSWLVLTKIEAENHKLSSSLADSRRRNLNCFASLNDNGKRWRLFLFIHNEKCNETRNLTCKWDNKATKQPGKCYTNFSFAQWKSEAASKIED